jgi:leucyl-tRNA synthetase
MSDHREYSFLSIEPKWQQYWESQQTFRVEGLSDKPKFYLLDMFPYPSGAGLHAGHTENYTASDILGRYLRAKGHHVLHPMGWDAFGLPAEQYAIRTGTHPAQTTAQNVAQFRAQIKRLGVGIDWSREVNTTDPGYYRWTQWIFLQLFKRGLAYVDERPVNWCPQLGTVLANEEVIDGKSEVGGFPVERRNLRQWVLRITAYADRLLEGLKDLDWPESTKTQQTNWIGRSTGAEIIFGIEGSAQTVTVFTTRPDTLCGATYMVMAPEHPLVEVITADACRDAVRDYVRGAASKSDLDRTDLAKEKSGVFTGAYAINPVNGERIPVWIADYVLMGYGTGAIMAVPAHDTRDHAFAMTYGIAVRQVIAAGEGGVTELPFTGDGHLVNSGDFSGLSVDEGKERIVAALAQRGLARATVNYRLRDWLFSRQRYWGEPFPIIWVSREAYTKIVSAGGHLAETLPESPIVYRDASGQERCAVAVPECFLPLSLPDTDNYKPSGDAQSPLANIPSWVEVWLDAGSGETRPREGSAAPSGEWVEGCRETNTMPQWAGSCWYYLRYCDPHNAERLIDPAIEAYWKAPDFYIGGAEHAVLHLLYARFWHQVLFDLGVVSTSEPFRKLFHQGIILGETEYRLFLDAAGQPVSVDSIANPDQWNGSTRRLQESEVQKVKRGKNEVYEWAERPEILVEARAFKMSKSRGNVVNPDDYIARYGADSLRMYEMFMGPLAEMKPWSSNGIEGPHRFLKKVWRLFFDREGQFNPAVSDDAVDTPEVLKLLNQSIDKVSSDIGSLSYNTAIAQLMILVNALQKQERLSRLSLKVLVQLLAPFAPHLAEELWSVLGEAPSVAFAPWPKPIEVVFEDEKLTVIFQVNGKLRGEGQFNKAVTQEAVLAAALAEPRVHSQVEGKQVAKVIYVPGKILNLVVR